jgi:hypothetical protein
MFSGSGNSISESIESIKYISLLDDSYTRLMPLAVSFVMAKSIAEHVVAGAVPCQAYLEPEIQSILDMINQHAVDRFLCRQIGFLCSKMAMLICICAPS